MSLRKAPSGLLWLAAEVLAVVTGGASMAALLDLVATDVIGRGLPAATILLSVSVAIVIQLWVKLNDLSSLSSLNANERRRLWNKVAVRMRSFVALTVFFMLFVFLVLFAATLGAGNSYLAPPFLTGVGAGCGASIALIAGVIVDLNEVAHFRWTVEGRDQTKKRRDETLAEIDTDEPGFGDDAHIQGYKRVSNGD